MLFLEGRRLVSAPVPISLSKTGRCDASSREILLSPQNCFLGVTWLKTDCFEEGNSASEVVVYGCNAVHLHAIVLLYT